MNIALIGYGKMGKEIEKICLQRNHKIVAIIDKEEDWKQKADDLKNAQVAIEFTMPSSAPQNIYSCFDLNLPVVVGTTGWYGNFPEIKKYCEEHQKTLFYASNYSIGVNILFQINRKLAELMNKQEQYDVSLSETHHLQKLDKPSGTALTLTEDILDIIDRKTKWELDVPSANEIIGVEALREADVFGIHSVTYTSDEDTLSIRHQAKNRVGFAKGAVLAAEFVHNRKGCFNMKDLIG